MLSLPRVLLALLAAVACTEGVSPPRRTLLIPLEKASVPASIDRSSVPTTRHLIVSSTKEPVTPFAQNVTKSNTDSSPSLRHSTGDGTANSANELYTTSQGVRKSSTIEPQPPILSTVFTTDVATGLSILTLPQNESVSSILFWSPAAGTSVTLTVLPRYFTANLTTVLPRHWHIIHINQPREDSNTTVAIYLYTEKRYINLDYSRVVQAQVGSKDPVHWCFCPNAHLCALPSPEEAEDNGGGSSAEVVSLMVALVVVGLLLVASLVALAGVAFYRKSELFHIYAKPVDCLQNVPPPLPKANSAPVRRHVDMTKETKKAEVKNGVTGQTEDLEYSTVIDDLRGSKVNDGEAVQVITSQLRPASFHHAYPHLSSQEQQCHESMNNLYGLV